MPSRIWPSFLVSGLLVLLLVFPLQAQIHGVPASVSSFGFGGSTSMTPGVAASVTSLGPNGFGNSLPIFGSCCFSPTFPVNFQPGFFVSHHRHFRGGFFPIAVPVVVPYYQPVLVVQGDGEEDDDYAAGPTVFERHGARRVRTREREVEAEPAPAPATAGDVTPREPEPVVAQPSTVLVFKDGHQFEVQNYAIVSDTLFDLSDGRSHKIQLADLDLPATRKANDDRGVEFQIPGMSN